MEQESITEQKEEGGKTVCKLKSDTDEICVPCEVANAAVALAAVEDAHPGQIDISGVDEALDKGINSVEEWIEIIEKVKESASGEAREEAELVTSHLYSIICEDEPATDQA